MFKKIDSVFYTVSRSPMTNCLLLMQVGQVLEVALPGTNQQISPIRGKVKWKNSVCCQ